MEAVELLQKSIDSTNDKLQEIAEELVKSQSKITENLKGDFDEKFKHFNELQEEVKDLKQAIVSRETMSQKAEFKSLGDSFLTHYKDNGGRLNIKAITSDDVAKRTFYWRTEPAERLRWSLFDLIPVSYVSDTAINYTKIIDFDNEASPVAETELKPHSHLTTQPATATLRTIAHHEIVTRQALKADDELRNVINNELYNGLILKAEQQIINGNSTAPAWDGLFDNSTNFAYASAGLNRIDAIRLAIAQVIQNGGYADGIIINPIDWANIETSKTDDGAYLLLNPNNGSARRSLWGLPVVDTFAMARSSFLVGAFKTSSRVFIHDDGVIFIDGYVNDQLIRNEYTIVAEIMGNVALRKPKQVVRGTFES